MSALSMQTQMVNYMARKREDVFKNRRRNADRVYTGRSTVVITKRHQEVRYEAYDPVVLHKTIKMGGWFSDWVENTFGDLGLVYALHESQDAMRLPDEYFRGWDNWRAVGQGLPAFSSPGAFPWPTDNSIQFPDGVPKDARVEVCGNCNLVISVSGGTADWPRPTRDKCQCAAGSHSAKSQKIGPICVSPPQRALVVQFIDECRFTALRADPMMQDEAWDAHCRQHVGRGREELREFKILETGAWSKGTLTSNLKDLSRFVYLNLGVRVAQSGKDFTAALDAISRDGQVRASYRQEPMTWGFVNKGVSNRTAVHTPSACFDTVVLQMGDMTAFRPEEAANLTCDDILFFLTDLVHEATGEKRQDVEAEISFPVSKMRNEADRSRVSTKRPGYALMKKLESNPNPRMCVVKSLLTHLLDRGKLAALDTQDPDEELQLEDFLEFWQELNLALRPECRGHQAMAPFDEERGVYTEDRKGLNKGAGMFAPGAKDLKQSVKAHHAIKCNKVYKAICAVPRVVAKDIGAGLDPDSGLTGQRAAGE